MIGIVSDIMFMNHDTGDYHPECPLRIQYLHSLFAGNDDRQILLVDPVAASAEDVMLNHGRSYVEMISQTSRSGSLVDLDPDTVCSSESYDVALCAAGSLMELTKMAIDGRIDSGFACVRPPGHHARRDDAMGFCLFNNVAVAAHKAIGFRRGEGGHHHFDVHHGNGTGELLFGTGHIFHPPVPLLSRHRCGLGAGSGEGRGTVNARCEAEEATGITAVYPFSNPDRLSGGPSWYQLGSTPMGSIGGMHVSSSASARLRHHRRCCGKSRAVIYSWRRLTFTPERLHYHVVECSRGTASVIEPTLSRNGVIHKSSCPYVAFRRIGLR